MKTFIYYKTNGEREFIESEAPLKLDELQKLVGGLIEFTPVEPDGSVFCANEEGLVNNMPDNPFARYRNQSVNGFFRGNLVQGIIDENGDFIGFEDTKPFIREKIELPKILFEKDKIIHQFGIGDFMGQTTHSVLKTVGYASNGKPVFKDAKKGARKQFTLRNLDNEDSLIFEGNVPFATDGETTLNKNNGSTFTTRVVRGNALINLVGDEPTILEWVKHKNINPFFTAYDRVNHIDPNKDIETLLFLDVPSSCKMVDDRRVGQAKRNS